MVQETELTAQGYVKLARNLWKRETTGDEPASYHYLRKGELTNILGTPEPELKTYDVDVGKLPKVVQERLRNTNTPNAEERTRHDRGGPTKLTTLNKLQGDEYDQGRALVEANDEDQIVRELAGQVLEEYTYSFRVGGREVVGLSYSGIKAIAQNLGNIEVLEVQHHDLGDSWLVKSKGVNRNNGLTLWGVAQQSKKLRRKDGSEEIDDFSLTKCASKSQRNLLRSLLPEKIALELLKKWLKQSRAP